MTINRWLPMLLLSVTGAALAFDEGYTVWPLTLSPVGGLEEQARKRVGAQARITLPPESSEQFRDLVPAVPADKGKVPNYARALSALNAAPAGITKVFHAFLYEGTIKPETKMAMALRIAQLNGSPYTAAHIIRLLRSTEDGKALLAALKANRVASLASPDQLALAYAEALTKEIHGLNDTEFKKVAAVYNDSQVVELTFTVCLFNYLTRLTEALNLPVEPWALETPAAPAAKWTPHTARVALVSDAQIALSTELDAAAKKAPGNLGHSVIANSLRAMVQVPALAAAFRGYAFVTRADDVVNRETKLQVSFAVSMANGCRYCTLHQVLGLRKLGVSPTKLVAMKKDDGSLTPRERVAVTFARKLTSEPSGITDQDYAALRAEFGERGSVEVLLWTCTFAFMNRFTDGLRLPSEDAAIQYYRETYGGDFSR